MKAIVYARYGPPEVLHVAEVDKPVPRGDEVLIRAHATTVSAGDSRSRSLTVSRAFWIPARLALGIPKPRRPILGGEFSGELERIVEAHRSVEQGHKKGNVVMTVE